MLIKFNGDSINAWGLSHRECAHSLSQLRQGNGGIQVKALSCCETGSQIREKACLKRDFDWCRSIEGRIVNIRHCEEVLGGGVIIPLLITQHRNNVLLEMVFLKSSIMGNHGSVGLKTRDAGTKNMALYAMEV